MGTEMLIHNALQGRS